MTTATIIGSAMLLIVLGVAIAYLVNVYAPMTREVWREDRRLALLTFGLVAWVGLGTMLLLVGR